MYDSVYECLKAHKFNRPQTFKELISEVSKSRGAVNFELNRLILTGDVKVCVLYFGGRKVCFYGFKDEVKVRVGRGGVLD
jgi:hypothetical protein